MRYFLINYTAISDEGQSFNGMLTYRNEHFPAYQTIKDNIEAPNYAEVQKLLINNIFEFKNEEDYQSFSFNKSVLDKISLKDFMTRIYNYLKETHEFDRESALKLINVPAVKKMIHEYLKEINDNSEIDIPKLVNRIFNNDN